MVAFVAVADDMCCARVTIDVDDVVVDTDIVTDVVDDVVVWCCVFCGAGCW